MSDNVQGITVGHRVTFSKPVTVADIEKYADVSGDTNPLHVDAAYAKRTRFKEPIAHGMLSAGVITAAIGTQLAPGSVVIYLSQNMRFRAPVQPGDTLTATITATAVDPERSRVSLETTVTKQDGTEVIQGDALVMVEPLGEA